MKQIPSLLVSAARRLFRSHRVLPCALAFALAGLQATAIQAAPITGKMGVGTWNTQAEFTDIRVTQGTETLYQSDFSTGLSGFTALSGQWSAQNGSLRQAGSATPALALVGSTDWHDYTLTLRARKLSGSEGFLIAFGSPGDGTKTWWNIGGWNNTQHALEVPGIWAPVVPGTIQTGRWYSIRVELEGGNVRCYLDGALVHDTSPLPIKGKIGVGTWNTQAEFDDIRVTQGAQTLYENDFSAGTAGWTTSGGVWQVLNGALRQTGAATPALALVGDAAWKDYTLQLRARKLGGTEGFLITFGSPGDSTRTLWNIGGWANTQHNLQAPGFWVSPVAGRIVTGRWYDIRVELLGASVRCYLDGVLVHDTERILDIGDRARRFEQIRSSAGFSLLKPWEQASLNDLAGRSVYVGAAARATFGAMPGSVSFEALSADQQAAVIRKVNRHRLTWNLGWGYEGIDPARRQTIIDAMDGAVSLYNSLGLFDKHVTANNSPGTPTADANYDGSIRFGGSYSYRVALHEMEHCMGVGTYYRWGQLMVNGGWTGAYANAQLSKLDGAGAVAHGDGMHFWPYGLNYDNESSPENDRRSVLMVAAFRRDMGIATHDLSPTAEVPDGLYRLTPRHAQASALEIVNSNPNNNAQVGIRAYTGADRQRFYLNRQSDGTYRIRTALAGNRSVELPGGVTTNGTLLRLWDSNGSAGQRWYLFPTGDGWYRISPANDISKGIDVVGIATADGTLVESWEYWDGFGQQWSPGLLAPGFQEKDLARSLSILGGLAPALTADLSRLNVEDAAVSGIDIRDAVRLARKRSGLEPNP